MSVYEQSHSTGSAPDLRGSEHKLLTIPQVLEQLGICRATFYEIVKRGDLTVVKLGGASRVRVTDLYRYIEELPQLHAGESSK